MNQSVLQSTFGEAAAGDFPSLLEQRADSIKKALTPREYTVLAMRYGLEGHAPHKIRQIAGLIGVSKERVRQLEYKAIRYLRD